MVQRPESPCTVPIPSRRNALSPVEPSASSEDPNYVAMGARPKWFKTGSTSGPSVSGSPAALEDLMEDAEFHRLPMSGAASSGVEQLPHQEIQLVIPQHRPRRLALWYKGSSTRILGKRASAAVALDFLQCSFQPYEGENLSVQPTTGGGQGDLLSSILLSMVVDEFLCSVDHNITIRSDSFVVDAMAFADELVVLASTQQGLQQQLDNLTAFLKLRGLAINVSKS
ncbi:hypothetical protein IscW_ISCW014642 [Ixodes scapularis]|uniref:Reverse transcriptase domain-containing protein n=1 Tax=Ixodes scapularis TaxID=6945 RepID=B7QJ70_IXOSC|nr:hypothetical protein IscW_ISCW014642 [Ixodes scapularis]|eukprot:XP_002415227.1 hypothetical protein IscW_ISCW014642 [Ixodes scapularis]